MQSVYPSPRAELCVGNKVKVLAEQSQGPSAATPKQACDLICRLAQCSVPRFGEYRFEWFVHSSWNLTPRQRHNPNVHQYSPNLEVDHQPYVFSSCSLTLRHKTVCLLKRTWCSTEWMGLTPQCSMQCAWVTSIALIQRSTGPLCTILRVLKTGRACPWNFPCVSPFNLVETKSGGGISTPGSLFFQHGGLRKRARAVSADQSLHHNIHPCRTAYTQLTDRVDESKQASLCSPYFVAVEVRCECDE